MSGSVVAKPHQAVAVTGSLPSHPPTEPPSGSRGANIRATVRAFIAEALLICLLISVYQWVRHLAIGHAGVAMMHAQWVWDLERTLHLPNEASLQRWVTGSPPASRLANLYYVGVHFPGTGLALAWLFLRRRAVYLRTRTELVLLTSAGLVVEVLFPLAPPRLMPNFGTVDTMLTVGPSAYPATDSGFANQYAAMPSLHVGWAILVAVGVIRASRSRWRWLVLLHPLITTAVVVVTANHYWLDGIVAATLLAISILLVHWIFGGSGKADRTGQAGQVGRTGQVGGLTADSPAADTSPTPVRAASARANSPQTTTPHTTTSTRITAANVTAARPYRVIAQRSSRALGRLGSSQAKP